MCSLIRTLGAHDTGTFDPGMGIKEIVRAATRAFSRIFRALFKTRGCSEGGRANHPSDMFLIFLLWGHKRSGGWLWRWGRKRQGRLRLRLLGCLCFLWGLLGVWGKLSRSAEEMENVVSVSPSGGDGSQNVDAVVDELEPIAQAEAPLDVPLDV